MAESTTITIPDTAAFKKRALRWASQFNVLCLLDSNQYPHTYSTLDWSLAVDALEQTPYTHSKSSILSKLEDIAALQKKSNENIFGFITYEAKNQIENLQSNNPDSLNFPVLYFFLPRYLLELNGNQLTVNRNYPETFELLEHIQNYEPGSVATSSYNRAVLRSRSSKEEYLKNVESIRQQIIAGDFYELNYCNEFYAEQTDLSPVDVFIQLNEKAKAPFSSFFKLHDQYIICASPERFLKKIGCKLIAQPIKGTNKRGITPEENNKQIELLQNDLKERAENIMIVDLTRNDLSKSALPGTTQVEELFGVYGFNTLNQMISTVVTEANPNLDFVSILKNTFPMGSMTGAPKIEVMKNIDRYENFKRSIYSGCLGYITLGGDFDFNVVIRSIIYSQSKKYISVRVGGAITYDSVAEKEWEEILLKAAGMVEILNAKIE